MPVHHTRGDDFSRAGQIELTEGSVNVSDMTHWTGRCVVRTQGGKLVQQISFAWLDASRRLFALLATSQEMAAWPSGTHIFEIELTSPSGQRVTVKRDQFVLTGDVAHG